MNYRHAYHAGNFADVMKHATLARVIVALQRKDTPIRVIDTHAGAGFYHLDGNEAGRTGEWCDGIGRLTGAGAEPLPEDIAALLAPYLSAVAAANPEHGPKARLTRYPGSPLIARHMLRLDDHLVANELHPEDAAELARVLGGDKGRRSDSHIRVTTEDGWHTVKAQLPPPERRGVVLIDPPFEESGELERLADALAEGTRRFATGVYLLWYPIKDLKPINKMHRALVDVGFKRLIAAELTIRQPTQAERGDPPLFGCGLLILNPPFGLADELKVLLAFLARRLAQGPGARGTVTVLAGEGSAAS